MSCDYYIAVYLVIEHAKGKCYYQLPMIRGYYCDLECGVYDSDDEEQDHYYNTKEYKALYDSMKSICLTPRKPVVIFDSEYGGFRTQVFKMKYLYMIQEKVRDLSEVRKVTKKEYRYDPFDNMQKRDGEDGEELDEDNDNI